MSFTHKTLSVLVGLILGLVFLECYQISPPPMYISRNGPSTWDHTMRVEKQRGFLPAYRTLYSVDPNELHINDAKYNWLDIAIWNGYGISKVSVKAETSGIELYGKPLYIGDFNGLVVGIKLDMADDYNGRYKILPVVPPEEEGFLIVEITDKYGNVTTAKVKVPIYVSATEA